MPTDWYYKLMGQEFGPLTSAELRQHAADGKVTRDAHVRKGSDGRWVIAESVKGLFDRAVNESSVNPPTHRPEMPTCDNCGRLVGVLESTKEYKGHLVCQECATRLQSHSTTTVDPHKTPTPKRGEIICPNPNCGFVGIPREQARGSVAVGCLLTLIMILPGLIYFVLMSGYTYICPKCGVQIRSGTHN